MEVGGTARLWAGDSFRLILGNELFLISEDTTVTVKCRTTIKESPGPLL